MERQLPHPLYNPLRYAKLVQQTQGFLIEAEYPLAPVTQHVNYGQPVLPGSSEVSPIQRIADDLAVLVYTIHARASVIHVVPRAAVQSGFHNSPLFLLQFRIGAREPRRDWAAGDQDAHVVQQIRDLGLRHVAQMSKQKA